MNIDEFKRAFATFQNSQSPDIHIDEMMALATYDAMFEKLAKSRAKGRGGWWDQSRCDVEVLRRMLREHVEKGDMIDVAVLAGMIYVRGIVDEPGANNAP